MNTTAFLETMINTLKYDKFFKEYRDKLLPILRRSQINSLPRWGYVHNSGRSGQRYEDVEIRVPVPLIDAANESSECLEELVKYVYQDSDEYGLGSCYIRPLIMSVPDDEIDHDVYFSEIEETVIQGIRNAKYLIWVAVAWFSNETLFNELKAKKEQGIDIRVIISDETQNAKLRPKLKEMFDLVVVPKFGWNEYNRMHSKFCIIDLDYVMHGSYNWTPTANYNEETLETALDKELVRKFADEFMRMYNERKK